MRGRGFGTPGRTFFKGFCHHPTENPDYPRRDRAGSRFGAEGGGLELGLAKPGLWIKEVNVVLTQPRGVVSLCFSSVFRQRERSGWKGNSRD